VRIAFVSPLPPCATGIADYSADVLRILASSHEIDVFSAQGEIDTDRLPTTIRFREAKTLVGAHSTRPFDAVVHQMGNGEAHDFQWELLARVPGLLVLHDLVLHHARARLHLDSPEVRAYAADVGNPLRKAEAESVLARYGAELGWDSPAQSAALLAVQRGTVGVLLPYAYPLFRLAAASSRAMAAHNGYMVQTLSAAVPGRPACRIAMPFERTEVPRERVRELRASLGLAPNDLAVAAFGLMTPEKRILSLARAFGRASEWRKDLRLLLVGPVPDRRALDAQLAGLGLLHRTVVCGRVPLETLPAHVEAADIVVHLRYPTARETSAALLRVLAQGRATVLSDLEHLRDIPNDAVLRTDVADEEGEVFRAILRLAENRGLRDRLAVASRAFVAEAHSPARCAADYESALRATRMATDPTLASPPSHWPSPASSPGQLHPSSERTPEPGARV